MPKLAARVGDIHISGSGGGAILMGCATVLIGGMPAARLGDTAQCGQSVDVIVEGEPTVLIGGVPASRIGDKHACQGVISTGCSNVFIGKDIRAPCLKEAAASGSPFIRMPD